MIDILCVVDGNLLYEVKSKQYDERSQLLLGGQKVANDQDLIKKVKLWKSQIYVHRMHIEKLNKLIEKSGFDEPVECLSCGWKGFDSEVIFEGVYYPDYGLPMHDQPCCPKCKSLSYEHTEL